MSRATRKPEAKVRATDGRGRISRGRRAVALALAVVLGFESMFSSGVPAALADALTDGANPAGVSELSLGSSTDGTALVSPTEKNATKETTSEGGETEASEEEVVTPTEEGSGEKGANSAEKTEEPVEKNDASQPSSGPEQSPTTEPTAGPGAETEAEPEQVPAEPRDWTGRTESLKLSSPDGLTFAEDVAPAEDGSLAATLDLAIELEASLDEDQPTLLAGDVMRVPMPEGITLDLDGPIDVYQLDDEGESTDLLVAKAEAEDDGATLKLTVVDSEEAAALAKASLRLSLPVTVAGDLLGEEPGELEWVLQTDAEDPAVTQTATLQLPAVPADEEAEKDNEAPAEPVVVDEETEARVEAVSQQVTATLADLMPELSYTYTELSGSAQMKITWCDNNSSARPASASYAANVLPQFSLDNGNTWISLVDANGALTDEARTALHIPGGETPAWAHGSSATSISIGTWDVAVSGMPTKLNETLTKQDTNPDTGEPVFNPDGTPQMVSTTKTTDISWRLIDTNQLPGGYTYGENDEGEIGEQRFLMSTQDYTFTITGKIGDKTLAEIFGEGFDAKAHAEYFRFSAFIDNKSTDADGNPIPSTTLAQMAAAELAEGQSFKITLSEDGNTATITAKLPRYDINGAPIVYYTYFNDPNAGGTGDYYQAVYDNSSSPSHGSAVDNLYDGGTMTIRPMGTTTFDAEKVWLDGNNKDNRPGTTFTLWRYSVNGSPATASQVQLNQNDSNPNPGVSVDSVNYVQITVPEGSESPIDLGELLAAKYGEPGASALDSLPKYDPDGYPYIYALREDTSLAGYEAVYGEVQQDGSVEDTGPNYVDANEDTQTLTRGDNDPFVYNNGTLTNRLTGTVEVEATKTWEIAAFQDSLDDVVVTFMAQSRIAGSNDEWTDTGETIEVDGWKAETLSQTFSDTFPQYDSQGRELEYRWVESGVALGGQETDFQRDGEGGGSFTLTLQNNEGEGEELEFTSTFEEGEGEDGVDSITNTFMNVTDEHVDKYWQQPDGSLTQIKPADADAYGKDTDDLDTDGIAIVQLFQDGELIGTFEMDGSKDPTPTNIDRLPGATYQETRSYHLDFEGLPKYSADGVRHVYLVLETDKSGWYQDRSYDAETRTTRIDNLIGEGEAQDIRIIKQWNDGDDSSHRLPVVVNLVAVNDIYSHTKNEDGTPKTSYKAGQVVVENIVLSAGESWYTEVGVAIGARTSDGDGAGCSYRDFRLVEVGMGPIYDDAGNVTGVQFPAVNSGEAESVYTDITPDLEWINTGWDFDSTRGTERVATNDHVYEISATETAEGTYNDDVQAVTATNRRLGLLDLTVDKTWNDQGEHTRPAARLVLTSTEYDDAFYERDGKVWVKVSDNELPVLDDHGVQLTVGEHEGGTISVENGAVIVTVATPDDEYTSTYHFFGLPKYDASGRVVHYEVTEEWVGGDGGVYTSTKTTDPYTVGSRHFHDEQSIHFTNTRHDSRDVVFNKLWQDHYVNDELSQRPDIYLTLYRVTVTGVDDDGNPTYSDPVTVDGYVNYHWTGTPDKDNPQYEQSCTIADMPAYDGQGREYIYYASESWSADAEALDYASVKFDYTSIASVHEGAAEPNAVTVSDPASTTDPTQDGTGWALHEGGTFVNSLTSELVAQGTKLWEDIPGNVGQGDAGTTLAQNDLPEVTVYLQRRVQGETEWPSLKFQTDDQGNWTFVEGAEAVAWTSELTQVTRNQYTYTMTHTGANTSADLDAGSFPEGATALPRYTADGELYEYRAIEVPWGLLNEPGGPTTDFINTTDFSELRDSDDDSIGIYVIEHGETGSFLIHNVYTSPTGSLTVQKHFTGREAGDLYPDTTFDVYRYYVRDDGTPSEHDLVDTVTLTNNMLATPTTTDDANPKVAQNGVDTANNTAVYTFDDLEIYAPDGSYWQYYVVEHSINGYVTTVNVGDVTDPDKVTGAGEQIRDDAGTVMGLGSGALCPVDGNAVDGNGQVTGTVLGTVEQDGSVTTDTTPDVTFQNTYTPELIDLSGTKTWEDFNNIFGIRPEAEEFMAGLTVERIGNGRTEVLGKGGLGLLQSERADDPYYFNVAGDEGANTYTITLANVDKWAPDGTAYRYRVTEDLSGMVIAEGQGGADDVTADEYYTATAGSSTVSADNVGNGFSLSNTLGGEARVTKTWVDGGDPYGLRPTTITVRLQARVTYADGQPGDWSDPWTLLSSLGYTDALNELGITTTYFDKTLNAGNGWRGSWQNLPMGGVAKATDHAGDYFSIEYRVVETKIGDQVIQPPTADNPAQGGTNIYDEYHPYQPSQTEWGGNKDDGFDTAISNTLETTKISATKAWEGDAVNGVEDAWNTRPGGDDWSVTYLLQRKLETEGDDAWAWVMQADAENQATSPLDDGIVRVEIPGDEVQTSVTTDGTKVTWENLPSCDTNGVEYEYRVVEEVPGSYDVTDVSKAEVATATDAASGVTYRYYVVESTDDGSGSDTQIFTNTLRTVNLTGTKLWDDHGTGIAGDLTADDMPQLTLRRATVTAIDDDGKPTAVGAAEDVKITDENGNAVTPQPTWTKVRDGEWTFTYEDLPAANGADVAYVYWAVEQGGTAEGYYPLYGTAPNQAASSHGAQGTTIKTPAAAGTTGQQTNETITNVATRLTLAKVSDLANDSVTLANIELSVIGKTDGKTYAVWTNGADGTANDVRVWTAGTTVTDEGDASYVAPDYKAADGLIAGLPAGDYIVRETGNPPAGYAQAADVALTINANGTVKTGGAVTQTRDGLVYTANVTMTDPVLRGHLKLTKYVTDDGTLNGENKAALQGAVFDLYQVNPDGGDDVLVASGLTTDANGVITTVNNDTAVSDAFKEKYSDNRYATLADGLPEGEYYFLETDATTGAVMPEGDARKTDTVEITQQNHRQTLTVEKANEDFSASVRLYKFDSVSEEPIQGARFQIDFTPEQGSATQHGRTWTVDTGADGYVTFDGLEKGTYVVTEIRNTGYESNPIRMTFTIAEDDDDKSYTITTADSSDVTVQAIGFKVTTGTFDEEHDGIPNEPMRGSVAMYKTGANNAALNDATFRLERMNGSDWTTQEPIVVAENLVTGQVYSANADNTGVDAGTSGTAGQIRVSNLLWGTYRFVETTPAPGYVGEHDDGTSITSGNITIGRESLTPAASGANIMQTVRNTPTWLELNKAGDHGEALDGAVFTVTPVAPTTFANGSPDPIELTTGNPDAGHAVLTGQLVVGGTYEIYEKQGPSGYDPIDETFQVTVAANGDLEVVGGDDALPQGYKRADVDHDGQLDNQFSFMATNYHMDIDLKKVSSRDNGITLEGATFILTGHCMDGNSSHTYTTDEHGMIHIGAGLMGGVDYTLYETHPADGYALLDGQLKFHMDSRGEIVVDGEAPEGYTVNDNRISFTVADDPVNLQITKRAPEGENGEPGEPLPWAEFSITPVDGSRFAAGADPTGTQKMRTGEDGTLSMSGWLIVGNEYDITETKAPEGYERVTGTMRIRVEEDGSISALGSVVNGQLVQAMPEGYTKVADNAFEVAVENQPIEIGIEKVGSDDVATVLSGAVFEITGEFADARQSETRSFTTGADGRIDIEAELKSGQRYTIREAVAPAGYELLTGELTVEVAEDGTLEIVGDAPAGYTLADGGVTIFAVDEPLSISFVKTDEEGGPLAGATFQIAPAAEGATFPDGSTVKEFTSDTDGSVFNDLQLTGSAEGTEYVVTELSAPDGYEVAPAFTILVFDDGHVELGDVPETIAGAVNVDAGGTTVSLADTRIEARIVKVSTRGDALAGAEFALTGRFVDGYGTRAVTVGEDGTAALENLVADETYTVRETAAPEGYDLIEGEWSFTVAPDGTLSGEATGSAPTFFSAGECGYLVDGDGVTLRAVDAPTPPDEVTGSTPKTGDMTNRLIPVAFGAAGLAVIAGALAFRRATRREERDR